MPFIYYIVHSTVQSVLFSRIRDRFDQPATTINLPFFTPSTPA